MQFRPITGSVVQSGPSSSVRPALRAGQVLHGVVERDAGGLVLQAGRLRIALEGTPSLTPGDRVNAEVVSTTPTLRLNILAEASTQTAFPHNSQETLAARLAPLLRAFPQLTSLAEATQLLSPTQQLSDSAMRAVLALMAGSDSMATDLATIQASISAAVEAGVLSPQVAEELQAQLGPLSRGDVGEIMRALSGASAPSDEARMALLANAPELLEQLKSSLRWRIAQLRGSDALRVYLEGTKQLRSFSKAVDRLLERLSAGQTQNLRSLDQAYHFVELPATAQSGFERGQIHFFGESPGRRDAFRKGPVSVVLDLELTQLGPLWVHLRAVRGQCACIFRTPRADVVDALNGEKGTLAEALSDTGYGSVTVVAEPWDGNRLRALARMFAPTQGLDATV